MVSLRATIEQLVSGKSLDEQQAHEAMRAVLAGEVPEVQIAALLTALRAKGEVTDELVGCAVAIRDRVAQVCPQRQDLVDIGGTGDDRAGTFNISTTAAIVAAGCGLAIAKHGNRSVSSQSGSADLLEAFGVRLDLTAGQLAACIDEIGIGFLFAPSLEPSLERALEVARVIGVRTILNVLDPLVNPAAARAQVMGVYSADLTEPVAHTQRVLGIRQGFVVFGADGMDEFSTTGVNKVSRLDEDGVVSGFFIDPADLGLPRARLADVAGGTPKQNARITAAVLAGERGPARDIVVLNAAAAMIVGRRAYGWREGIMQAEEAIDSGAARRKLEELIAFTQRAHSG